MAGPNDLHLALLIKANADQAKAQLAQVRTELAGVGEAAQQSSATATAASNANAATAQKEAAAVGEVATAQTARAETDAEAAARIHAMVQASAEAAEAERERGAAIVQTRGSLAAAADANSAYTKSSAELAAAQTASMRAFTDARAPVLELQTLLQKSKLTSADVAQAEALLDRAQVSGAISAGELADAFTALDAAKIKDVAVTKAQSAAQKEAAGFTVNSRLGYSLSALVSDAASGQAGRSKRELAALANESGLFAKLLTPTGIAVTGLAASVSALAVAFAKGEAESTKFATALISVGGYAGVTNTELHDMAGAISGATIGQAKDALLQLASSGKFAGDQLQRAGQAAVDMSRVTGQSLQSSIQAITALRDDPVNAIQKLNEQFHFLDTATFQQIQRLQELGQTQQAADLAEQTYATNLRSRAEQVQANLGDVQRWWGAVKQAASDAWDAMEGIGRKPVGDLAGLQSGYDALLKRKTALEDIANGGMGLGVGLVEMASNPGILGMSKEQMLAEAQSIGHSLDLLRGRIGELKADAKDKSAAEQMQADGVAASKWAEATIKGYDKVADRAAAVARVTAKLHAIVAGNGVLPEGVQQLGQKFSGPGFDYLVAREEGLPKKKTRDTTQALATDLKSLQDQLLSLGSKAIGPVTGIWDQYDKAVAQAQATAAKAIKAGGNAADVQQQVQSITDAAASARDNALAKLKTKLQQQLAQATGDTAAAAQLQIQQQWGALVKDPRLDADGKALVDKLIDVQEARAQLDALQQEVQTKLQDMSRQEQTIQAEQQAGLISDYTARQQILKLHQATGAELEKLTPQYRALAEATGDPRAIAAVKNLEAELGRMQMHISDVQQALQTGFESGLENALTGLATGAMTVANAFRAMAQAVAQSLAQSAARALASKATDALTSFLGGGAGGNSTAGAAELSAAGGAVALGGAAVSTGAASLMASAVALQSAATTMAVSNAAGGASGAGGFFGLAGALMGGFDEGGFTGPGAAHQVAGIVHAGEGVLSQRDIAAIGGAPGFHALRRAIHRGYAGGGFVHPLANAPQPSDLGFSVPRQMRADLSKLMAANDSRAAAAAPQTHIHVWSVEEAAQRIAQVPSFQHAVVHIVGNNPGKIKGRWGS